MGKENVLKHEKREMELEEAVGTLELRLRKIDGNNRLLPDLSVDDLKSLLGRVHDFIDFCKMEFGEDITE